MTFWPYSQSVDLTNYIGSFEEISFCFCLKVFIEDKQSCWCGRIHHQKYKRSDSLIVNGEAITTKNKLPPQNSITITLRKCVHLKLGVMHFKNPL